MRALLAIASATALAFIASVPACGGGSNDAASSSSGGASSSSGGPREDAGSTFPDGAVAPTSACKSAGGTAKVAAPAFVRNIASGETGWFSSPAIIDVDGDKKPEIVAPFYSTFVFDAA